MLQDQQSANGRVGHCQKKTGHGRALCEQGLAECSVVPVAYFASFMKPTTQQFDEVNDSNGGFYATVFRARACLGESMRVIPVRGPLRLRGSTPSRDALRARPVGFDSRGGRAGRAG